MRPRRPRGRCQLARRRHDRRGAGAARGRRHRRRAVLAGQPRRRLRLRDRRRHRGHRVVGRTARRDPRRRRRVPRCSSRSTPACRATARTASSGRRSSPLRPRRPPARSRSPACGRTSPAPTSPAHPANDEQERVFTDAVAELAAAGVDAGAAAPQQLRSDADPSVGAPRPRAGRHRVVRHQPRSATSSTTPRCCRS